MVHSLRYLVLLLIEITQLILKRHIFYQVQLTDFLTILLHADKRASITKVKLRLDLHCPTLSKIIMEPFKATHEILTPAGEHIPVRLISQKESVKYRVLTAEQWPDPSTGFYEWHPSEGVSYQGIHLAGLTLHELEVPARVTSSASKTSAASSIPPTALQQKEILSSKTYIDNVIFLQLHRLATQLHCAKSQESFK
jgi:hypothetical protein